MSLTGALKGEIKKLSDSFSKLKDIKGITMSAMLTALYVMLSLTNISITQACEVRFTFVPIALCGMLLGSIPAVFAAAVGDILGYLVHPTGPYFPGFTVCQAVVGLIYGISFYKRKNGKIINILKTIVCITLITVLIDILLQTYFLSVLYGIQFTACLISRMPKIIVMYFIELAAVYFMSITYESLQKRLKLYK